LGDAGLLVTSDDELAARARVLRVHGAEKQYFHKMIGGNFRIDALQAALLKIKLAHLRGYTERRRGHAAYYNSALAPCRGSAFTLPSELPGCHHVWNQYTLRVANNRDQLRTFLSERGIASGVYYPLPLHRQECFVTAETTSLPVAEQLARECLSIPVYSELTKEQLEIVADAIGEFAKAGW
jgi:dTDP-4-amino-4,6-dideoxygalactose transaminase